MAGNSFFDALSQSSTSSSSLLAALAIGVFTVVTLFTQVTVYSPAWLVLSVVYACIFIAGILIFRNWAIAELTLDYYIQQAISQGDEGYLIDDIVGNSKIRKFFFMGAFQAKDKFFLGVFITIIILAILVWVAFAFQWYEHPIW